MTAERSISEEDRKLTMELIKGLTLGKRPDRVAYIEQLKESLEESGKTENNQEQSQR